MFKKVVPIALLLFAILSVLPSHAQKNKTLPIAPCLPYSGVLIKMTGKVEFGEDWVQVIKKRDEFYALEGETIQWLGYARKGHESEEWYGETAGFGGVNMFLYGDEFLILIYDATAKIVGRIEVHEYPSANEYIFYFTTLYQFGLWDGSRYDYHIPAYPNTYNRTACMFRIAKDDFNSVTNWQ